MCTETSYCFTATKASCKEIIGMLSGHLCSFSCAFGLDHGERALIVGRKNSWVTSWGEHVCVKFHRSEHLRAGDLKCMREFAWCVNSFMGGLSCHQGASSDGFEPRKAQAEGGVDVTRLFHPCLSYVDSSLSYSCTLCCLHFQICHAHLIISPTHSRWLKRACK